MRNRFKGLDLIDKVPDELWTEVHDIVQEKGIKTTPKKKKCKKAKWLSEEALQIAVKKKKSKKQRTKGKIKKPSSAINAKRKTIEWERLEISSIKLEIPREHFMQR